MKKSLRLLPLALACASLAALPAPAADPSAAALSRSDFASGAPGWSVLSGDFKAEAGAYRSRALTNETKLSRTLTGDKSWKNYTVEARVKLETSAHKNSDYGLVARYQDGDNYYMFLYKIRLKKIVIERKLKGKLQDIAEAPLDLPAGGWHTIAGTLVGDRIEVAVDGRKLAEVTDPNFGDGGIGLLVFWGDVQFDDVVVRPAVAPAPAS